MTDEMPPFRVQTIEPVAPHGGLQKPQVRSDLGIHSVVMKHCRRCELVEIGRHRYRSAPAVRQCCVDSHRSEEHTSELQSRGHLVCRLLLEKKKKNKENERQS